MTGGMAPWSDTTAVNVNGNLLDPDTVPSGGAPEANIIANPGFEDGSHAPHTYYTTPKWFPHSMLQAPHLPDGGEYCVGVDVGAEGAALMNGSESWSLTLVNYVNDPERAGAFGKRPWQGSVYVRGLGFGTIGASVYVQVGNHWVFSDYVPVDSTDWTRLVVNVPASAPAAVDASLTLHVEVIRWDADVDVAPTNGLIVDNARLAPVEAYGVSDGAVDAAKLAPLITLAPDQAIVSAAEDENGEPLVRIQGDGTIGFDTGRLEASAPFSGWVRAVRSGSLVTLMAAVRRTSGTGRASTGVILPPGLCPVTNQWFVASPFYGYDGLYQFTITTAGSVDIRNTAAGDEGMQISTVYALGS